MTKNVFSMSLFSIFLLIPPLASCLDTSLRSVGAVFPLPAECIHCVRGGGCSKAVLRTQVILRFSLHGGTFRQAVRLIGL
jgi:hypothetical protein